MALSNQKFILYSGAEFQIINLLGYKIKQDVAIKNLKPKSVLKSTMHVPVSYRSHVIQYAFSRIRVIFFCFIIPLLAFIPLH